MTTRGGISRAENLLSTLIRSRGQIFLRARSRKDALRQFSRVEMPTALSTTLCNGSESFRKRCLHSLQSTGNSQLVHVNISPWHTLAVGMARRGPTKSSACFSCPLIFASLKGISAAMSHLDHTDCLEILRSRARFRVSGFRSTQQGLGSLLRRHRHLIQVPSASVPS